MSRRYILNGRIIHENIQDEFVIVNLDTGNYYSLEGVGAAIWGLILERSTASEIVDCLAAQYSADLEEIRQASSDLLSELIKESLVTFDVDESNDVTSSRSGSFSTLAKKPFEPPVLNKYTDMAGALMLDPIHEVDDELGWPTAKKNE